jgi:two-component system nitrogen regulation response regulator GlnG
MSQAVASCKSSRSVLPCLARVSADRGEVLRDEADEPSDFLLPLPSARTGHLLLIGDDLAPLAQELRGAFPAPARRVQVAGTGRVGLEHVSACSPDVILLDLTLPDQSGLEVHRQIRGIDASIPVIFVTRARRADAVIATMKQGAYDCLFQPLEPSVLRRVVGDALEVARRTEMPPAGEEPGADREAESGLVGCCPEMQRVFKDIGRVAGHAFPVLVTGESGTGKEVVARAVHRHGPRADAPFVALNCAAIPESLLESELFGHEKGSFTGADRKRVGKFEQADGGTLFLDEIGDMPLPLQAKILRVLQEQSFERVGGNETIRTNVRLIAATHRDLRAEAERGRFRPDLYWRLAVFGIHLPPLRERGEDLEILVRHFLGRFSRELGRKVREVAPEALEQLRRHGWPGNIRELQSVLKQALLQASGTVLLPSFLPQSLGGPGEAPPAAEARPGAGTLVIPQRLAPGVRDLYSETHRELDRLLLPSVLDHTGGNVRQAALLLGIARQTLRLKLRDLGLPVGRSAETAAEETDPAGMAPAWGDAARV